MDARFDSSGDHLVTVSKDKTLLLWNVYGDCENYGTLRPSAPRTVFTTVLFSPLTTSTYLFAGASDGSITTFDLSNGSVVRRHRPPISRVCNSVDCVKGTGRELLVSGGDDGTVRVWSLDQKEAIEDIELGYPITSVKWSLDGQQLFIGGIDNDVHCYDLRCAALNSRFKYLLIEV